MRSKKSWPILWKYFIICTIIIHIWHIPMGVIFTESYFQLIKLATNILHEKMEIVIHFEKKSAYNVTRTLRSYNHYTIWMAIRIFHHAARLIIKIKSWLIFCEFFTQPPIMTLLIHQ